MSRQDREEKPIEVPSGADPFNRNWDATLDHAADEQEAAVDEVGREVVGERRRNEVDRRRQDNPRLRRSAISLRRARASGDL